MGSARQEILERLQKAVHDMPEKPDFDAPVYHSINGPLEEVFKENLEKVNGSVYLFQSEADLFEALKDQLLPFKKDEISCHESDIVKNLESLNIPFSKDKKLPDTLQVGITGCEFLLAHTGSVMVSSAQKGGRQLFIYPPVHIAVAKSDQLVDYLETAYSGIQKKYKENLPSQISLITGPSRTADIEKTLVMGAHGPKELRVFLQVV